MECDNLEKPWWTDFFSDPIAELLLERHNSEDFIRTLDFLVDTLELQPGDLIYDQCCGTGEIACGLARRGLTAIGVDYSASYIQRAQEKAQQETLPTAFYQADACDFVCPEQVRAAVNWYTSFGYNTDDQMNRRMLQNAYNNIQQGGLFILDYHNPPFIFKHFVASQSLKKMTAAGELICHKESSVDALRGLFLSTWTYTLPNGTIQKQTGASRIYFARDLIELLVSCGFKIKKIMGSIEGEAFSEESPRCILLAQKT